VERTLRRLRAKPQEFLELNSIETIVELVRDGMGVAMLPSLARHGWEGDPRCACCPCPDRREPADRPGAAAHGGARRDHHRRGPAFVAALAVPD
jgi:DNA-binding transcriptional LysR family regulator